MPGDRPDAMPATVEEYLAGLPDAEREALERVRQIIRASAPEATERISYRMPVFADHGDLVGFAAQATHLSLYTMSPPLVASMRDELRAAGIGIGGSSTLHFTPDAPLPADLVARVVAARLEANRARRTTKGGSPSTPRRDQP